MATVTRTSPELDVALTPILSRIDAALEGASGRLAEAARHLLVAGGKHLRPLLVVLSAEAVRSTGAGAAPTHAGPTEEALYDVAAAVEMIHVASLIHDDIIDEAATRRSVPSVNARWDAHTAVLAGDYLFASAFGVLARYAHLGMAELMTGAIRQMCQGEILQREQAFNPDLTEEEYVDRVRGKTAALLAAACEAGARLSGADPVRAGALREYGLALGLAFQVIDDVLDLDGEDEALGKATGSDLRQGVVTLPVIHLLAEPRWKERFSPLIRRRTIGQELAEEIRLAARESGATERARLTGFALAERAAASLAPFEERSASPAGTLAVTALKRLCRQAVARAR